MTFDEALQLNNIKIEPEGVTPLNGSIWYALLTDLATSLYKWASPNLSFFDLLQIEKYIHQKKMFAIVKCKRYLKKGVTLDIGYKVLECTPLEYGARNIIKKIRILIDKPLNGLILEYNFNDFVIFDDYTLTSPSLLVKKYTDILGKLDALYIQNIDKLSIPIIACTNKNQKNDLLNIFKRTKLNALFSLVNSESKKDNVKESFYNPQIDFLLDRINNERQTIMKEFLQELGINPRNEHDLTSQYINDRAIAESSLISKYFATSMNKYRDNFVDKVNKKFSIGLTYETTVKNNLNYINKSEKLENEQINKTI